MCKCIVCKNNSIFIAQNTNVQFKCLKRKCKNSGYERCSEYISEFNCNLSILELMEKMYLICSKYDKKIYTIQKNDRKKAISLQQRYDYKISTILNQNSVSLYNYRSSYIKVSKANKLSEFITKVVDEFSDSSIYIHLYYILLALDNRLFSKFSNEFYNKSEYLSNNVISELIIKDINENKLKVFLKPQQKVAESLGKFYSCPNHANNVDIKYKTSYYLYPFDVKNYNIKVTKISRSLFRDDLRIGISPLGINSQDLNFEVRESYGEQYFKVKDNIDNYKEHKKAIINTVKYFIERKCNIIVFPELTIPPKLVNEIKNGIEDISDKDYPLFIVAGTFHNEYCNSNKYYNQATILSNLLNSNIFQHKLGVFENKTKNSDKQTKEKEYYKEKEEILHNKKSEYLRYGAKEDVEQEPYCLNIVDTNDFRIVVLICSDFITDDIFQLLKEYMPNLIIVSSWQGDLDPKFTRNAEVLSELNRATTIISNHCHTKVRDRTVGEVVFPIIKVNKEKIILKCNLCCQNNECICKRIVSVKEIEAEQEKLNTSEFELIDN